MPLKRQFTDKFQSSLAGAEDVPNGQLEGSSLFSSLLCGVGLHRKVNDGLGHHQGLTVFYTRCARCSWKHGPDPVEASWRPVVMGIVLFSTIVIPLAAIVARLLARAGL